VYYPQIRQIDFKKPSEISITIGGSSINILDPFPTYENTDI